MATHGYGIAPGQSTDSTTLSPVKKVRVAFQGERGAYGDDAIAELWRGEAIPVPSWSFNDVVQAVLHGSVDCGVLPIENTVVGLIAPTLDALVSARTLAVLNDIDIPIRHALLAPKGATLDGLRTVTSHPVALAQCGKFLGERPSLRAVDSYDTAGAARDVAARNDPTESAIASVAAAARYKLQVMAEDIQDVPENTTRFVVIARRSAAPVDGRERW
jgi:prephenate dehydratase